MLISSASCVVRLLGAEDRCVVWKKHVPQRAQATSAKGERAQVISFFSPSFAHPGNI